MSPVRYLKENIFAKPYRLLPLAVFTYFALAFLYHPFSAFRTFQLADPDDYMRLDEVMNWLGGQGWFDLGQPRISPGDHVIVHWARLVDVPLALVALPLIKLFGMQNAVLIASFIVPPALFGVLVALTPMLAEPLLGKDRANLATLFLLFAPVILFNFSPGRADHHDYEILVGAIALLGLQRLAFDAKGWPYAIIVAVALSCGFWIGTEILPWAAAFAAGLAMLAAWRGGAALRNAAIFGAAFPLAMAAVLTAAVPPSEYFTRALSWFSGAEVIFALLTGAAFVAGWALGRLTKKPALRLGMMLALGLFAATLFVYFVPDVLFGAYADYDDFFNSIALGNISEAQPFLPSLNLHFSAPISFLYAAPVFLRIAFLPLLACCVVVWNLFSSRGKTRELWFAHAVFLLPAFGLTLFWQTRVSYFAEIYAVAPACWLLLAWWKKIAAQRKGRERFWAEIGAFMAVGLFPAVLLPSIVGNTPIFPDIVLFPAARSAPACPLKNAGEYLAAPWNFAKPQLILSGMNEGPELLFRTPHSVLAAPYDNPGSGVAYDFFHAHDPDAARSILQKRHVDLVLVCRSIPLFYAGLETANARAHGYLYTDKAGNLRVMSDKKHPTMIEKLVNGAPPRWLKPIVIPFEKDYLLFEVRKGKS